ncbi:MAG: citrate synthase [Bacteriovoracaceae bacterium]|jgi:citrate synthase|nr:citrate synthase [Bacteriovoracaceae bacterium]
MTKVAKIELEGQTHEFPIIEGSEGEKAIDISKLRGTTGHITLDNGFANTGSCRSAITFLNGEQGILRYRGYPIEQLSERSRFMEVSYLLGYGELPNTIQLKNYERKVANLATLPHGICKMLDHFPKNAHPMGVASSVTSALSSFYPDLLNPNLSDEDIDRCMAQMLAQTKIIISYFYRRTQGLDPIGSNPELGYAADFLNMMFAGGDYVTDPEISKALDVLLILHADHEQNCSASTVRVVGSSLANVFASVSGGINALWGQLHGGANQAVLEMLNEIKDGGGDHKKYIQKAKDKNDSFRLMGFGHRVYKSFDPRAKIIKGACDTILTRLGVKDPLLDIAKGLEEEALRDEYFKSRNLYPNVDFYSGIIYQALGIPTNMFTAMFVLGRIPGWLAQWKEMRTSDFTKIARPRQIYTGYTQREFIDLSNRN